MAPSPPKTNRTSISRRGGSTLTLRRGERALVPGESEKQEPEFIEINIDVVATEGGFVGVGIGVEGRSFRRRRRGRESCWRRRRRRGNVSR